MRMATAIAWKQADRYTCCLQAQFPALRFLNIRKPFGQRLKPCLHFCGGRLPTHPPEQFQGELALRLLLLKCSPFQRMILAKIVVFARINATCGGCVSSSLPRGRTALFARCLRACLERTSTSIPPIGATWLFYCTCVRHGLPGTVPETFYSVVFCSVLPY